MPQPNTAAQRADLGQVAYEYMLDAANRGFIGSSVFPIMDVMEKSADYPIIPTEALLKAKDVNRGSGGDYNRDDYEFEFGTYAAREYGWEERVPDDQRNIYARFYDLDEVAVKRAIDILMRQHEKRVAAEVFNTANLGNGAVSTEWSTAASATPYADIMDAKVTAYGTYGIMPNKIAMSWKVFMNLIQTADFRDTFQYTAPSEKLGMAAMKMLVAQYFDVEELLVGNELKDTAKKGQTKSLDYIWDDEYVLLFRGSNSPDLREPQLGKTFLYSADSPDIVTTEQYREEQTRSDVFRVRHYTDEAFIFTGAGYLLANITAQGFLWVYSIKLIAT